MRTWIAAVAVLALVGCGHHSPAPAKHTPRPSAAKPQPSPRDREPHGRLSAAEYRAIVLEYTLLKPLQSDGTDPKVMRGARAACTARAPNTRVMQFVQKDCLNALAFFGSLTAAENASTVCERGDELVRDRCFSTRYARLGSALRAIVSNGLALNKELQRRGITGLCARSIGIPRGDVVSTTAAAVAAEAASQAAAQQDDEAFVRAQRLLAHALAQQSAGDPLEGIKHGCPHEGTSTPNKAPAPKTTPAPTPKKKRAPHRKPATPRIPQPGDGIKA